MKAQNALNKIQTELKAPKNLYNSFGKYKYRNFEGICEAVKPLLAQTGTTLVVTDSMENIGDRYYIKAKAVLTSVEDGSEVVAEALAREPIAKKGMDEAQITGATSSYARKYCLNGLFLLDDTKDPDTDESHIESEARSKKAAKSEEVSREPVLIPTEETKDNPATSEQIEQIEALCKSDKVPAQFIASSYNADSLDGLTVVQAYTVVKAWDKFADKYESTLEGIPFE